MVIDCAKGVEERTIKLMEVCRLRDTPIMTFINKLDRDGRQPIELLDEIEKVLSIRTAPITWPIGMGRELRGIYHLLEDRIYAYSAGDKAMDHMRIIYEVIGQSTLAYWSSIGMAYAKWYPLLVLGPGVARVFAQAMGEVEDRFIAQFESVFERQPTLA